MAAATKAPYGNVAYADPGYQTDRQKRYPLDTEAHVRAAWSYINMPKNAAQYSAAQLASIKGRIKAAGRRLGMTFAEDAQRSEPVESLFFQRCYPLEDIHIQRTTDQRTVEAYAAVFDVGAEISDGQGHYLEVIDPAAFNKVLNDVRPQGARRSWQVGVFYNHAMTAHGTPSESASVPIGTPLDIRPDGRGLLTVTRYANTSLANDVLEAIREGAINGQSFTGRIVRSNPDQRRYLPTSTGRLTTVRRLELGLAEYGPTPMPAYRDAAIVSVRSLADLQQDTPESGAVDEFAARRSRMAQKSI